MGIVAKILMKSKNNYDPTAVYEELDYVRYANCTWVATQHTVGNPPPSDPTGTSDYWTLLVKDGEYLGQYPSWTNITSKPFDDYDTDQFEVDSDGTLHVVSADTDWEGVTDKPFETLNETFSTTDDELDIKIDGTTIYKDANGVLKANASSAGFDIHSLQEETTLSNTDEFPFFDISANGTRKTLWSNIIAKLTAMFTKVYNSSNNIVLSTTIKDTIEEVNANGSSNQLAGALAVKSVFRDIAPLPTTAPTYSTSKAYSKGDVCLYNGSLYYCVSDVTSGSQFDSTKWSLWSDNLPLRFGVDADGNYGYYKVGADSVTPFRTGGSTGIVRETLGYVSSSSASFNIGTLFPNVNLNNVSQYNFAVVPYSGISNSDWNTNPTYYGQAIYPQTKLNVRIPSFSYNTTSHVFTVTPQSSTAEGRGANSGGGASATATQSGYVTYVVYFYHV